MKYLTNREAAHAMLDGKKLLWRGVDAIGSRIDMRDLDRETDGYTLAPETITRTVTYPKPYAGPMDLGQKYWIVSFRNEKVSSEYKWVDDELDCLWRSRGLVHLTEDAAVAHAKALIGGEG